VYLLGGDKRVDNGDTHLIPIGTGVRLIDFLLAPVRLLFFARMVEPSHYFTADIVFSWWTAFLIRWFVKAKVVLMPVSMPEEIYRHTGRSMTGLPISVERMMTLLCFQSSKRIVMGRNSNAQVEWLNSICAAREKLKVVSATVEEYPPLDFFRDNVKTRHDGREKDGCVHLLYVGRLHPEKHVSDLVAMMAILKKRKLPVKLHLVGDGPERSNLSHMIERRGLTQDVIMHGFVPAQELPAVYRKADIFVSTLTGTALREAGLMGLPIVAYDMDWVSLLLEDGKTGLLAEPRRPESLAEKVEEAIRNPSLRKHIAQAFQEEAKRRWSLEHVRVGLQEAFGDIE